MSKEKIYASGIARLAQQSLLIIAQRYAGNASEFPAS
jgi:hypothetical protein